MTQKMIAREGVFQPVLHRASLEQGFASLGGNFEKQH
jgi:hypothetical protein